MNGQGADPRLVFLAIASVIIAYVVVIRAMKKEK